MNSSQRSLNLGERLRFISRTIAKALMEDKALFFVRPLFCSVLVPSHSERFESEAEGSGYSL